MSYKVSNIIFAFLHFSNTFDVQGCTNVAGGRMPGATVFEKWWQDPSLRSSLYHTNL